MLSAACIHDAYRSRPLFHSFATDWRRCGRFRGSTDVRFRTARLGIWADRPTMGSLSAQGYEVKQ